MTLRPLFLFFALWGCLLTGGCALLEGMGQGPASASLARTPEMEKRFYDAEKFFYARRFSEAETAYQNYLRQFPANALTAKAAFRLGEIHFHEKDLKQAVADYKKSLSRGVDPEWGVLAIYKLAVCYSRLEDSKKVFEALDRLPAERMDARIFVRAGSLRVAKAKKAGDPLQEMRGYLELIEAYETLNPSLTEVGDPWILDEKTAREQIRKWIDQTEAGERGRGVLEKWTKRFDGKSSGGYLLWKLARLSHENGDYKKASDWAGRYLAEHPKHEYASLARSMVTEVAKRGETASDLKTGPGEAARPSIGVLLPLSGKYAVYGESILHGLECAAGIFAPCRGDLGIHLAISDSRGDPGQAARIVEEFSRNENIRAVVGPLPQVEVDQASVAAENAGLPMIALSQKPGLAKSGQFIFRNFLTVADQVATVVHYACRQKRWKKFAILYPQGVAGQEYRNEFKKEVDRCGGDVVAEAGYSGDAGVLEALRGLKFSSKEQDVEAPAPFQALFIPDVYRRIHRIAEGLKFLNLTGVHLLGGAGWNHPGLLAKEGEGLEGAVFVDGFFARASGYATRDFVSTFQSAYGVEPTLLEAYAYDTLRLLGEVLRDHPTLNRLEFQKALAGKKNFPGVTGNISFDDDGDARRKLFVLTVEGGEIKEVR